MKQFYPASLIFLAIWLQSSFLAAQQTLFQGFERTSADNWAFIASPVAYNVPAAEDFWTDTTSTNAIPPASGSRFWFMLDLENPSGGGAFFHTLDFQTIDVSSFSDNTLTFRYFTNGYEAADSLGYILMTDNGTNWDFAKYVDLNRNTLAWTTVTINLAPGAQFVRLRLMAKQNGGSDFAGFDDVQLFSSNGDVTPPTVVSAAFTSATSIRLAFSEALNTTAETNDNYTGVPNLASALRNAGGDTVTLTYSAPFANGQPYTLTVANVEDAAGNALAAPFEYSFIYNNSVPNLVITEINYNPPSPDPDTLEFIEFYNNGAQTAELGGLLLSGVVQMTFPTLSLAPGQTFLVAQKKSACELFFAGQTFYQWASGVLTNGGNTITLRNSEGVLVDEVVYDDAFPWPVEPDGNGPSLELLSPNLDNNDGANWKASTSAVGTTGVSASPGVVTVSALPTISFVSARTLTTESAGDIEVQVKVDNLNVALAEARVRVLSASTAVAGEDYVLVDSIVAFPAGATTPFPLGINLIDDNEPRNSRYLILQLTDFTAAAGGTTLEHAVLISDDDTPAPASQPDNVVQMNFLTSYAVDVNSDATAEISSYDPLSKRLFSTNIGLNRLEIIDFSNPYALVKIQSIDMAPFGGGMNSLAANNGVVAVAVSDSVPTNPGKVVFFDADGNFLSAVTVGVLPDHVNFTPDGSKVLTADEGQPSDDYSIDPEGTVSVIDLTPGAANLTQANVTTISFAAFNDQQTALVAAGLRVFGPNATLAQDVEPEYIAVSDDGNTAFVTLQENSGVGIIDLQTLTAAAIVPQGVKNWAADSMSFDASDNLSGIFFNNWNVNGMYNSDAIDYFSVGGQGFLITANEGDAREYDAYEELVRLSSSAYVLDPATFPDAAYLKRSDLLGRLNVTTATGDTDGDGDFDEIHTLGGRSVSIWNAATGARVWDSGDDFERITAADPTYGSIFNASNSNNTRKNRSDDKGPEPEGVVVGEIDGRLYAFVALERIGGIMLYDVTDPQQPEFIQWINNRTLGAPGGDLGSEGVIFIPKNESPNGRNLVVLSNEVSGTVSVYEIRIDRTQSGEISLDKYAFDNTPVIGVYGDTIREGGVSGLFYRDGSYRFISDRGPNADALNSPLANGQTALLFPFPDYAPKVWQVTPQANGTLQVNNQNFIKRPNGTGVTGIPLPLGQGNTGEVAWSDTLATPIPFDAWGLDSEGLVQDNEGNWWICDEYGTSIWQLDANFRVIQRYTPFPAEAQDKPLDAVLGKRRANRGLEGIAYTPNGKIFALLQSPANNPNSTTGNASRIHRLIELDPKTGATRTFAYVHDPELGQIRSRDWKIGDLAAINNEEFLALEHAERNGWNAKNIYKFNLNGATPITTDNFGGLTLEQLLDPAGLAANGIVPVQKEFYFDLLEAGWELQHDKPEGLAIVNDSTFAVVNDNDFGVASPNGDGKIVLTGKTTRLYVYGVPADKKLNYVSPYCTVNAGNDQSVCVGQAATLTAAGAGFSDFSWSNGLSGASISVTQPGTYTVVATTSFGCTDADAAVVTNRPTPAVNLGTDKAICEGATTTLQSGYPGASVTWSTGATSPNLTVGTAGVYSVNVTFVNGCSDSDTVQVTVNPVPVVSLGADTTLCEGQTLTLNAANPGAVYEWSNGATTPTITVGTANTYSVEVTNDFGCSASDTVLVNVVICPGTDDLAEQYGLRVFPNPTAGPLEIQFATLPEQATFWSVLNNVGQQVRGAQRIDAASTGIDLGGLPKGMYFLRIQSGEKTALLRVAVQ